MSKQDYAFSLFQEECGEAMQSIGKAGRFGLDTPGVKDPYTGAVDMSITPRTSLQKELGDVAAAIDFLSLCGIVDKDAVNKRRLEKLSKLLDPSALDNLGNKLAPVPKYVAELEDRIAALEAEKAERERQEPVAWAWNDALGCMHAHCGSRRPVWVDGECSDAKRAETSLRPLYAAPPIPRVEQEPVAWVLFDDIFIAPKDMQDDPPNLECMKPLYAHPLALREPTEDECRRIANEFLILGGPDELAGRVMFNAVREVMKNQNRTAALAGNGG